jgi:RNA-directed DNA polymerase
MGLGEFLKSLFGLGRDELAERPVPAPRFGLEELARRLGAPPEQLGALAPQYREFRVPKRSGGHRIIHAPAPELKAVQRTILRRLLGRLTVHTCATGFEPGRSIVTNALPHVGKKVVLKLDVREFFPSTGAKRVEKYFGRIGWDAPAARLLTKLVTHGGALPQGAPTSPRLSNLLNYRLDQRLAGAAGRFGAAYTRYADDITFSFARDDPREIRALIRLVKKVLKEHGYTLHQGRKLQLRRRHDQQRVTGLVVNEGPPRLPRRTRRWLRAVAHRAANGGQATLSPTQLAGWGALLQMVEQQGSPQDTP